MLNVVFDLTVGIVATAWAGRPRNRGSIPSRNSKIISSSSHPDGPRNPTSLSQETKLPGPEANCSPDFVSRLEMSGATLLPNHTP